MSDTDTLPENLHAAREFARWQAPHIESSRPGGSRVMLPMTAERLAQIEDEARSEGYRAGLEQGRLAGAREIEATVRRLGKLFASIAPQDNALDDTLLDQLAHLVLAVARQLLRRELKRAPGEIVPVIREALAVLPVSTAAVKLFLHPDDAALVRGVMQPEGLERPVQICEDLTLTPGGARIETDTSVVDATVEARLNAVAAQLFGDERGMTDESRHE